MENDINKDTNTLVDNEVTDIFEELDSGPEQPVQPKKPDQPIDDSKISDIEGTNYGFTNDACGYELQDPSQYQYQEGYNWHPEADMTYPAPDYPCYDQVSNPCNRSQQLISIQIVSLSFPAIMHTISVFV